MTGFDLSRRGKETKPILGGHPPNVISFGAGDAFPALMPDLTTEAVDALTRFKEETLQYAPLLGLPDLRHWISQYLGEHGVKATPEQILVVNGAKHGLDLICRLLLNEGDCVAVTAPTYFTGIPIFRGHGVNFLEVPQDDEGLSIRFLRQEIQRRTKNGGPLPKVVYDIPDFHNPSGITMSERRRTELVELAAEYKLAVIEDSPYREIRFCKSNLPPLKSLDKDGRVFQLGTFAKLLAPGLRIGWVATTEEYAARLAQLKSDGGTCPLTQRIIYQYCAGGKLTTHLVEARAIYREHRDRMVAALKKHIPQVTFKVPDGGYYIWIGLNGPDSTTVASRALEHGVEVIPGSRFFTSANSSYPANRSAGAAFLRLSFSFASPEQIDLGIQELAGVINQLH